MDDPIDIRRTLKHVAQYSPLLSDNQKRIIQTSQPNQYDVKNRFSPHELQLSELGLFLNKQLKLNVPVFTVWGACEDVRVLEKFRSGEYKVDNLTIIDESTSRLLEIGGVKLRLLGLGGAVVMHKLFDNGEGRTTIAGGQGTMWTTLLQMGELIDTANRVYDPTETRILVTHASPAREGILNQIAVTLKADFSISAGLHFRYGSSYNEFSVNPTLDHYRGKLAASRASFTDVWETVRSEVEPAVAANEAQQTLLTNALDIVMKMPAVANGGNPFGGGQMPGPIGIGQVDESAFKNMWNFNLADAAFGYLVMEVQDGRIATEMRALGFNFAHRGTGGKPPIGQSIQTPTSAGPPNASMQGGAPQSNRGPGGPASQPPPNQQYNQAQQARNQPQANAARPGPPSQQPSQAQQSRATPAQSRGPPGPTSNAPQSNTVKPATPQPTTPTVASATSPKPAAKGSVQAAEVQNGTATNNKTAVPGEKSAPAATESKPKTKLFLPGVEGEQAVRDSFDDEDKTKIVKIDNMGGRNNHIIEFATQQDAESAMKRHKGAPRVGPNNGQPSKPKWFEERERNPHNKKPRDSTGGQGAGTWQASNRSVSNTGPRPGYQSGASDSESRSRGGFQGRGRGPRGDRGRGGGRGGRGGQHKGGDDSSTPPQENKAPAPAAPAAPPAGDK